MLAMVEQSLFDIGEIAITRISLTKLCSEVARSVAAIGVVAVEGEVVKPISRPSGWTYFTLADRASKLSVAVPGQFSRKCRCIHGERVLVTGSMQFSSRTGQLNLEARQVVPVGEGAIQAAIAETRAKLAEEGVLDRPRRPIPLLPAKLGIICGAEAAVRGDIQSVIDERFPGFPTVFLQVPVSGPAAAESVSAALSELARQGEVDVAIIARGGGDPAALFPFSDGDLCRAIALAPFVVVTAIGHERDRPLCDEVSDLACNTPSLAAIRVVPDELALRRLNTSLIQEAYRILQDEVQAGRAELDSIDLLGSLALRSQFAGDRLASIDVQSALAGRLASAAERLAAISDTIEALSPVQVLKRGYAIVRLAGSEVAIRSSSGVRPGRQISVQVADGQFEATVKGAFDESSDGA